MLLAAVLNLAIATSQTAGHYFFAGPLKSFMLEGATPGVSTSGLRFSIPIASGGSQIGNDFELKGPSWDHSIHLHLNEAKFAAGHLTGTVHFKNESGKVLEGLRLDLDGATESYSDAGQTKTRAEAATLDSPLLFGDIQAGDDSDAEKLDIGGLSFGPQTKEVDVTLKLSGLAYLGEFKVGGDNFNPGELSVDSKGRVYVTDHNSGLWRTEADGSQPQLVGKWGDVTDYAFVDPSTGDLIGHESNSHRIIVNSASGEEKGKVPASEDFGRWPTLARADGRGNLYVTEEDHICVYKNGFKTKDVESVDGVSASDVRWDVTPDGTVYLPTQGSLYRVAPDLASAKKIAFGPDWHLGRITNVASVRVDPAGNIYVLEGAAEGFSEYPRVSVFDKDAHFVRVFGRGAKAPKESQDEIVSGGVGKNLYDAAFGADGRFYLTSDVSFGRVLMFMPF